MAKLSDFVPGVTHKYSEMHKLDQFVDFFDQMSKQEGSKYTPKALGSDRFTNAWIQQRVGYRRHLLLDLWSLYLTVAEVRSPISIIRNEVFRRGYIWSPKFELKCEKCGSEYQKVVEECEKCGEKEFRKPDEKQKDKLTPFMEDANIFGQSLNELFGSYEDCLNWADDAFLYVRKEYINAGNKVMSKPKEIRVLHPAMMDLDLDDKGLPKNKTFTCYFHRDEKEPKKGKCKKCKADLVPVMWIYYHQGTDPIYLLEEEVLHLSKFSVMETFGVSPLITLYDKILSLVGMDKTIYRYFFERKLPAGMLLVATDDPEGLRRERANIEAKMRVDPDYMPMIAYSARQGSRGRVDFVKLFHNLLETDYLPIKNDVRDRIAAMWGVSPIWMSAQETSGGIATQSVTGETPIYVRVDGKYLDIIPIASLYKEHSDTWYRKTPKNLEVWTEGGWSDINGAYRHRNINEIRSIISGDGIVNITGNHAMKTEDGLWLDARDFEVGTRIKTNRLSTVDSSSDISEEFAWSLGLWCAEGDIYSNKAGANWTNIDVSLLERAKKAVEDRFLKKTTIKKYRGISRLTIYGKSIVNELRRMCLSEYDQKYGRGGKKKISYNIKKVPMEVLNGTDEVKRAFIDGYYAGDGRKENAWEVKSVDSVLIAGVRYLCNSLGYETSLAYDIPESEKQNPVYILTRPSRRVIPRNEIKKIVVRDDSDKVWVYDIETSDHTFVIATGDLVVSNTQQLVVTSRVVESDQKRFNDKIFPWLLDHFGINEWKLLLKNPEEKSEQARAQFMQQKTMTAMQLQQMGFKVELVESSGIEDIDFKVSEMTEEEKQQQQMSQMGGMMGGLGGGYEEYEGEGGEQGLEYAPPGSGEENSHTEKGVTYHSHDGHPPHPANMPHETSTSKQPLEEDAFRDFNADKKNQREED